MFNDFPFRQFSCHSLNLDEVYIVASSLSITTRASHWCIRDLAANLLVPTSSKRRMAMDGKPLRLASGTKGSPANSFDG
jgi:hypothetical protein